METTGINIFANSKLNGMEDALFQIALVLLPALVVLGATYMVMNRFFQNEQNRRMLELRKNGQNILTPVRLQAFERLMLLMERINPEILIMRVHKKGMSARQLQQIMIQSIRAEYEHNMAQQIYVSPETWALFKKTKEELIQVVNLAAEKAPDSATGIDLTKAIYQLIGSLDVPPTKPASEALKREVRRLF